MTVEDVCKRNVLVGIRFDEHAKELLDWAILKVADQGDCVTALHVCQDSDTEKKNSLDDYLNDYEGLCNEKKINLTGVVLKGSSIRKVLVREAKNRAAMTLIVGITKPHTIGRKTSLAKYCAGKLPLTTGVVAVHNGKVIFRRFSTTKMPSFGDPRPSFSFSVTPSCKDAGSEFDESEAPSISIESDWRKDEEVCSFDMHRKSLSSLSTSSDIPQQIPGWPLLRAVSKVSPPAHETREMSVVQWVMNLPSRSSPGTPGSNSSLDSTSSEIFLGRGSSNLANKSESTGSSSDSYELPEAIEILKTNSSGCRWFSYEVLKTSTSHYSSDCIIGKGGCNSVYKGILPEGKTVAVKVLKSSKEAWKDFCQEVDIMTFLDNKNITPLLGVCVEENNLISVYDYMARGNLEDNLQITNINESVLSWEVRYNIAVGIAEALNHIHNECPQPVIHRDVKSSNILLTEDYKPMLSDFGLAIWGPTNSSFLTHTDVLGTFGYLAPEYFMYGKVSDKIDVYSFGVVLLELLSGKRAIAFKSLESPESLVMWAKPILESGDVISILDPNLGKNYNKDQVELMALAAVLCLTRAARLRPNMSQILKLLRGEKDVETGSEDQNDFEKQSSNDDEVYQESIAESHLSLAILDLDKDSTSVCSNPEESPMHSLNDYKPMLSDFGLAIWGPTNSSFLTHTDVLGTFGYLAPEYFMYGKVSDKIDVYSFGVVLLELLSGKRAIAFKSLDSPESLVMWGKPILESGDVISILDPNLGKNYNKDQVELMALAAVLCLTRAARLRPNMSQILKLLRGEKDVETGSEDQNDYDKQSSNDDEVYQESIAESHLSLAILDLDKDSTSVCSNPEESPMHSLNDYLKGTCNN